MASTSLSELEYLRRLQKYQKRKSDQIEHRLQRLKASCEIRRRLVKGTLDLQYGLSEAIQLGNKRNFALLYHTVRTAEQACDRFDTHLAEISSPGQSRDTTSNNFLDRVLPSSRDAMMDFLSRVAFDPGYLLDRLLSLSHSEFLSLLNPVSQTLSEQSVFGNSPRKLHDGSEPGPLRDFLDFSRHNPLSLILQLVTKDGVGTRTTLQAGRTHAWATICAGLLTHQKPGSDKFVVAILNAHLHPMEKPARQRLDTWLLETLRDGDFLLDKPEKHSFRMRTHAREGLSNEEQEATERFYSRSIKRLLELLKNSRLTGVIPTAALDLSRSIVEKLKPSLRQQQAAPYFLCTRWLFASYLTTLIKSPESQGLLLSYHVSSTARSRILNEIALRAHRLAFDVAYTWKHSAPVEPDLLAGIEDIVDLFRSPQPASTTFPNFDQFARSGPEETEDHDILAHVTVCKYDLVTLVHSLCPEQHASLFRSTSSFTGSTLHSSASSVSGMSLFRTCSPNAPMSLPDGGTFHTAEEPHLPNMAPVHSETVETDGIMNVLNESFTLRLKEACNELEVASGYDAEGLNCDPFSETWTTLRILSSGNVRPCPTFRDSGPDLNGAIGSHDEHVGTETPDSLDNASYDMIRAGILMLLDDFGSTLDVGSKSADVSTLRASLIKHFDHATSSYYQQGRFAKAHTFFQITAKIKSLPYKSTIQAVSPMLNRLAESFRLSISRSHALLQYCDSQTGLFGGLIERYTSEFHEISQTLDCLREKMWYVADIQSTSQYEDLRRLGSALRVMGSSARYSSDRSQPPLRHRGVTRPTSQDLQLKAEAATLELLSAPVGQGGPNKLSDVQVQMTLDWMQSRGIENVCKAEELLHRFCLEVSRCIDCFVGETMVENPILWSSELYQQQRPLSSSQQARNRMPESEDSPLKQLQALYAARSRSTDTLNSNSSSQYSKSQWISRPPPTAFSSSSLISNSLTHDYFGRRSPTLTNRSSTTVWSAFSADAQSPSSATSLPSRALSPFSNSRPPSRIASGIPSREMFLEELKQTLTGLFLSDFGHLFREGSETDRALREPLQGKPTVMSFGKIDLENKGSDSVYTHLHPSGSSDESHMSQGETQERYRTPPLFDFSKVFSSLLNEFELEPSPYKKLDTLLELQSMLEALESTRSTPTTNHEQADMQAQCRYRLKIDTFTSSRTSIGQDAAVQSFRRLFRDSELRPKSLFRDLQFIASLVPLHTLDSTAQGRAFWNATIAALDLKQEICQELIEMADRIVSHHTFNRGHSRVTSAAQAQRDSVNFPPHSTSPKPDEGCSGGCDVAELSMADAATLLQATAKEGLPAAQRELATLYLTHPDLLGVCMAPLSRSRDIFKDVTAPTASTGRRDKEKTDWDRYDPVAMAMAQHWMELSAKGGDGPAAKYLRAKDEFDHL